MKRIFLAGTIACTIGLLSCSKEKTVTVTETVHDTTTLTIWPSGQINGDSLSAGLKLAYSTAVKDSVFPAASTSADAPGLDSLYDKTYVAAKGGLLTIYPANTRGYVQGYYVQIVGAKSYFKVDLSLSEPARKKMATKRNGKAKSNGNTARGYGEGYVNGTLAFEIPSSLKGDTFYVKYAAYDKENRVSKPTTATVVLLPTISNPIADSLKGTWVQQGYKYYAYGQQSEEWYPVYYDEWDYHYYSCDNNVLSLNASGTYYYPLSKEYYYSAFTFNGAKISNRNGYIYSELNLSLSTCTDTVYTAQRSVEELSTYDALGYTFDAKTRKITVFYADDEDKSNTDIDTETYRVWSLSANELILLEISDGDYSEGELIRFIKK